MKVCSIDGCERKYVARGWCQAHYKLWKAHGVPELLPKPDLLDRLSTKFLIGDDCWPWIAAKNAAGYGLIGMPSKSALAHRVVYELMVGKIPEGLGLDHLCRNPSCVRPDHLEPVTQKENIRRGLKGVLKTHCPQGHEYTEENTYCRPSKPERQCLICLYARNRARHAREKAARCAQPV